MDTNIVADELPISDDEQAKSERFLSLLQVQELSPKEKDIASILATHDRPALPVPKPTDPVKKVVSAKDAVPPIPKSAPRPESDEEWVNHDDWHTNQRLYDDRCPYCRKNPRYKPVDKPSRFTIRADGGESVLPYYVDKWDKRFKSATINVRSTGKDIFLGSYTELPFTHLSNRIARELLGQPGQNKKIPTEYLVYEDSVREIVKGYLRLHGLIK